jgi:integrase
MAQITAGAAERFVKLGVPAGKPHVSLRDGSGLVLRLLPSGVATWYFVGRLPGAGRVGTQRMVTIGRWPTVDLVIARRLSAEIKGKMAGGIDPAAERKEKLRQEKTRLPVALAGYEAWLRSRRLTKVADTMSALHRGFRPLERRSLEEIDRPAIVAAIEKIERAGLPGAAADFRKVAATFFNRQISLGVIKFSPLAGYRRPKPPRDEIAEAELAGRALTEAEIVSVWSAAGEIGGSFGGIVRIILATGLRRNEAANLRWVWIDRKAGLVTIPARAMKAGSEHVVIVTEAVARILDETPDRAGGLVFPGRALGGKRPVSGWSKLLKRLRAVSGVDGVGLHDMRRTFRSVLADLDVPEPVAEMMIAHKRPDLIRRYNRSALIEQRRQAAHRYDEWLSGLLGYSHFGSASIVRLQRRDV